MLDYCVKEVFDMSGFLRLVCMVWVKRRVLKNTSSKHEQLGSSLCNVAISSRRFNGHILALFYVLLVDRLYSHTLNNICCHICVCYSFFKFHFLFYSLLLEVSDAPSIRTVYCITFTDCCWHALEPFLLTSVLNFNYVLL